MNLEVEIDGSMENAKREYSFKYPKFYDYLKIYYPKMINGLGVSKNFINLLKDKMTKLLSFTELLEDIDLMLTKCKKAKDSDL